MTLSSPILSDQPVRDRIARCLDTTFFVEAAAGTGKTKCLVDRLVALIKSGACPVDTLVAVTFTRKAAAELRDRFRSELQRALTSCAAAEQSRLELALKNIDRGFIGTIHSFCALLLRERPIEARIDPGFVEIEPEDDDALRREAWQGYAAGLIATNDPRLAEFAALGLELHDLEGAFVSYAEYPDVDAWVMPAFTPVQAPKVVGAIRAYLNRLRTVISYPVVEASEDALREIYLEKFRLFAYLDTTDRACVMRFVASLDQHYVSAPRDWGVGSKLGKAEREIWQSFLDATIKPALEAWYAECYAAVTPAFQDAAASYQTLRVSNGALNFQDLLMRSASLLQHAGVRRYFRRRFTHLLVDEFQDTDPIQAEVMLLLTADNPNEEDWRACTPAPGALFVVGDPKQSIYRFRRADIVTYNMVKRRLLETGGEELKLTSNFRTVPAIMHWVNATFTDIFPATASDVSPAYVELMPARTDAPGGEPPLQSIQLTENKDYELDADTIAQAIARMVHARTPIARADGSLSAARYQDFLILTPFTTWLGIYADALQARRIPHRVTGGDMLNSVPELRWLYLCLHALLEPDNPVALLALLRSELCGCSDAMLYAFQQAGGVFHYRTEPEGFPMLAAAYARLRRYAGWCAALLPMAALERIIEELTLIPWAAAASAGVNDAGCIFKAFALLRKSAQRAWTLAELVEYLRQLSTGEAKQDGAPLLPEDENVVRVMNLHKAKGLEAPVVFLAAPKAREDAHPITLHVDRRGEQIQGYMAIYAPKPLGGFHAPLLACPSGWDTFAQRESEFIAAENDRLLYVAATRAGAHLIISRIVGKSALYWHTLADRLPADTLAAPSAPASAAQPASLQLSALEVAGAAEAIDARWSAVRRPNYALTSVREAALDETEMMPGGTAGGTEFGRVIHRLLQTLLQGAVSDLPAEARRVMVEERLPDDRLEEVLATLAAACRTTLWQRACAAPRRLLESPLIIQKLDANGFPTIIRGVIDLAFAEAGAWVLVDFKSDDTPGRDLAQLTTHYTPQLLAYADAWSTHIPVKEIGLLFVRTGNYIDLSSALPASARVT